MDNDSHIGHRAAQAARIKELERELRREKRALAEQSALLAMARRSSLSPVGGRGSFHAREVRETLLSLVHEARGAGARLEPTCQFLGISPRTLQRWCKSREDRRALGHRAPANSLSEDERRQLLALVDSHMRRGLSPRHIVTRLADQGLYLASESTMYRLLRSARYLEPCTHTMSTGEPPPHYHVADGPNLIWSWDISQLKGPVVGRRFHLYLVMDIFSRRIMGWRVAYRASARSAACFIRRTCKENGVDPRGLLLRSDNGGPMRGAVMRAMLRKLGILPSFSRPGMSSDNAFSEAMFRTLKHHPSYPQTFSSLDEARTWVSRFVHWYNREHLHSGISYVTPDDRHFGRERELLARRNRVYEHARRMRPERWARPARTWAPAGPSLVRASLPPADSASLQPLAAGDISLDMLPTHAPPPHGSVVVAWEEDGASSSVHPPMQR